MIDRARSSFRLLLAAAFAAAGIAHLAVPEPFLRITPDWVFIPATVVALTGMAEIAGAAGLLFPRFRRAAAWCLAVYTVCVFPANVTHAWMDLVEAQDDLRKLPLAYHAPRLLFQPIIVWWCLFAGAIIDWPLHRRTPDPRQ